jgi:hypothetical protein
MIPEVSAVAAAGTILLLLLGIVVPPVEQSGGGLRCNCRKEFHEDARPVALPRHRSWSNAIAFLGNPIGGFEHAFFVRRGARVWVSTNELLETLQVPVLLKRQRSRERRRKRSPAD